MNSRGQQAEGAAAQVGGCEGGNGAVFDGLDTYVVFLVGFLGGHVFW